MQTLAEMARSTFGRQLESKDSGTVCLSAILRYHEDAIDPSWIDVLEQADYSLTTLLDVCRVAGAAGFRGNGYRADVHHLMDHNKPCILHAKPDESGERFVVCYGFENGRFVIGDPLKGIRSYSSATLSRIWRSRALLVLEPGGRSQDRLTEGKEPREGCGINHSSPNFRCLDAVAVPFGGSHVLLRSRRTGRRRITSTEVARQLFLAGKFLPLEAYATALQRDGTAGADSRLDILPLIGDGMLISEEEVRSLILAIGKNSGVAGAGRVQIASVGIPTSDRPECLRRALKSYVDNCIHFGRSPSFTVADDSVSRKARARNRELLDSLNSSYDLDFIYADQSGRRRLAVAIARRADVPAAITAFALLGQREVGPTYGANRNYLLLATAGEVCLQVDDDTICGDLSISSERMLSLSAAIDPNEYWFGAASTTTESVDDIISGVSFTRRMSDFVGFHEQLLGREAVDCIADIADEGEALDIRDLDSDLLSTICSPEASVAATFCGSAGDCGSSGVLPRLFLDGPSWERLEDSPLMYERAKTTRRVLRAVRRTVVGNSILCTTMNVGLDNRRVLPPFMPVGRAEDGVFGTVLRTCFRQSLKGYVAGFAILHYPPEERRGCMHDLQFPGYRTNEILIQLILSFGVDLRRKDVERLSGLGQFLVEIASLPQPEFDEVVVDVCERAMGLELALVERAAAERSNMRCGIVEDLQTYAASLARVMLDGSAVVPSDLSGTAVERRSLLRHLIGQYGQLLIYWPAIVGSAKSLRAGGNWRTACEA